MANRTIAFATYTKDGTLNTTVTPTVTVSYGGAAATALTPTANGNLWNVTVDDTQDATLLISGSGLATADLIVLRRDLPVPPAATANATAVRSELATELGRLDATVSSRLATAGYSAPDNATIASIDGKVDALNDLSATDVQNTLAAYDVATVADIPTDYATATAVAAIPTTPLLAGDYVAPDNATIAAIDGKVDALNDLSLVDVGTALTDYGTAKATDIPTDYSTFDATTDTVTLSDKTGFSLVADYDPAKTAATQASVNAIPTTPLLAADYTAPDNAGIASTIAKIDALNDISTAEVAAELTAYGAAKVSDLPTDYSTFDPATDTVARVTLVDTTTDVTNAVTASVDTSGVAEDVWTHSDRTLTSAGAGGATAKEVWEYGTRSLTDKDNFTLVSAYDPAKTAATQASVNAIPTAPLLANDTRLNNLDATVSSRLADADYTEPDNAGIASANSKIDAVQSTATATQNAVSTLNDFNPTTDTVASVQTVIDPVTASVDVSGIPAAVWSHADRTLTEGAGITAQDVWEYANRTLTSATGGGATAQEVWEYTERLLTADIPTETADLLATRHGVGLWGAADASWPVLTHDTLDIDGVPLGPLNLADVLVLARSGSNTYGTRSDGDGEFSLQVPPGATYTLSALMPGFTAPDRIVEV